MAAVNYQSTVVHEPEETRGVCSPFACLVTTLLLVGGLVIVGIIIGVCAVMAKDGDDSGTSISAPGTEPQHAPVLDGSILDKLATLPAFTFDDWQAATDPSDTRSSSADPSLVDKIKKGRLVGTAQIGDAIPDVGTRVPLKGETTKGWGVLFPGVGSGKDASPDYALAKLGGKSLWPGDRIALEGAWFDPEQ